MDDNLKLRLIYTYFNIYNIITSMAVKYKSPITMKHFELIL